MKQLGNFDGNPKLQEQIDRLIACAEKSLTDQGDDEALFKCHHCLDTKFTCKTATKKGYPGEFLTSKPCEECAGGRELLEAREDQQSRGKRRDQGHEPNSSEKINFANGMKRLCLQFSRKPTEDLIDAYWEELQDYSTHEIARGLKHAARKCRYMPRIAEILEGINGPPI